ncbi:hypothetical protein AE06_05006 [Klebsiella variicola]|nr:hypothetical protein AE06_05006 [Klebsiella variicola]
MRLPDKEGQCHTDDKSTNQINYQGARWKIGEKCIETHGQYPADHTADRATYHYRE